MSDQYPSESDPYGGYQSTPYSSGDTYSSDSSDPYQSPYASPSYETPAAPSIPSYESVFESTQRTYQSEQLPAYETPAEPTYATSVFDAAPIAQAAPAEAYPPQAAQPVYQDEPVYQQHVDPAFQAAAVGAAAGAAFGASGAAGAAGGPGPSSFDAALGSARGVAADTKGFLPALFDFGFTQMVTPKLVRFVYLLATIGLGVTWLLFLFSAFSQGAGFGLMVLVLGPVLIVIYLALIRMTLEFYLSITRMSEDINRRLPQA